MISERTIVTMHLRLPRTLARALDDFRSRRPALLSRTAAVRVLVEMALATGAGAQR